MTTGWVKSLQCKSKVLDDVVTRYGNSNHLVPDSSSCKKGNPNPGRKKGKSASGEGVARTRRSPSIESLLPALTELPEGHPSRNVVEIIFRTSWSDRSFSGRVQMVFKVQNLTRTFSRFEEYREMVKARSASSDSRCVADGNELLRFYCTGGSYVSSGGAWGFGAAKGGSMCTYSASGGAHQKAGSGNGRRAMLVCRVIAGRVFKEMGCELKLEARAGYDSVSTENDELFVFDSRAVLPCFLIIYKL